MALLVIVIAAALADSDTVEDIVFWARTKEAWLRPFLVLKNGTPSESTFLLVFGALDPKQFEQAVRRWVGALGGTLAIDGKTVRGSGYGGESAIHMVSAFVSDLELVLGQERWSRKATRSPRFPSC